jgi:hypothetical protein
MSMVTTPAALLSLSQAVSNISLGVSYVQLIKKEKSSACLMDGSARYKDRYYLKGTALQL